MEKKYIIAIFITCVLSAFFATKIVMQPGPNKVEKDINYPQPAPKDTTREVVKDATTDNLRDTIIVNQWDTIIVNQKSTYIAHQGDTLIAYHDTHIISQQDTLSIHPKGELVVNPGDTLTTHPGKEPMLEKPKPVKMSLSEMKRIITNGTYEKDHRLSKRYKIEYVDVSDDDAITGLQQNFTFIQERIEFETWRDFEVVGLDYDGNTGLVNYVKIRPIY